MPVFGGAAANGRALKVLCSALCPIILASNFWTMRHWTERTGVYVDICYLRQAHLFQRFGLAGLDTSISRDDDGYFSSPRDWIYWLGRSQPRPVSYAHRDQEGHSISAWPALALPYQSFQPDFSAYPSMPSQTS
jgi:hypothetical protein